MQIRHHEVRLTSRQHYGKRLPPAPLGRLLGLPAPAVRQSIQMAMQGRSTMRGRRPHWLEAASDIRLVDLSGNGDSVLHFEAPLLGEAAEELYRQHMLRKSTQSFGLQVASEPQEIRGALVDGDFETIRQLLGQRVMVEGWAVYRPSGRLLRLDAERILSGDEEPDIWARIPPPLERKFDVKTLSKPQTRKSGISAFFGTWPGDETDEELLEMLKGLG